MATIFQGGSFIVTTRLQALLDIVLALLLTIGGASLVPLMGALLVRQLGMPVLLVLMLQGVVILAGLRVLLAWRGQRWRHLGLLPFRGKDIVLALWALLAVFAVNLVLNTAAGLFWPDVLARHQQQLSGVASVLAGTLPLVAVGGAMAFVGFYEEVLARGFLLTRSRTLMGGIWGPVLLSSLLFGVGHLYQGSLGVVQTALVGVVFARLALHWGTLWPVILAHAALNTLSLAVLRLPGAVA